MYLSNLSTERLNIRPLTIADIQAWAAFFEGNDGLKFFTFDPNQPSEEKARSWIDKQLWRYKENLFGHLALTDKQTGNLIGQCGLLTQEVDGKAEIEIGYHVLPQYWGKGLATEAARALKQFAWDNAISDTLISIIHVDNIRSQRVAEKNGMQRTIKTEFQGKPVYIYRISKPE
jgi:ribosomal-protein-alanine N-acetyltransferase